MGFEELHPETIIYRNRIIFLFGVINEGTAFQTISRLLVMNSLGSDPIKLFINSPGGEIIPGMAIYDTMQFIETPVYTVCIGQAASMAAWLLAAGAPGNRMASENAKIMIHQGRTMMGGTYSDLKVNMEDFEATQKQLIRLLSRHTGKASGSFLKL